MLLHEHNLVLTNEQTFDVCAHALNKALLRINVNPTCEASPVISTHWRLTKCGHSMPNEQKKLHQVFLQKLHQVDFNEIWHTCRSH